MTAQPGGTAPAAPPAEPAEPALYICRLRHVRTAPIRNDFTYRTYLWMIDLARLPCPPGPLRFLAGFRARDHLGDPRLSLRENVDRFLAGHGIDLAGGSVTMLASARVFGYVFNPLTVYWCHDRGGDLRCVIAEVHNTYGGMHCYLLAPDAAGRASAEKAFYVSPFIPIEGDYRMLLPEPGERLALSIRLERAGRPPFVASLRGTRRPATTWNLLRTAARLPLAPQIVSARIRVQGLKLFLRGLPVLPRKPEKLGR
ncbi:DUF1365 domain-containing protein [Actinocrinis puniceicyclus]|uniref:DUF1365 domain-containing protein n=1 Tax=Actinocrinis puniceicyclus TaxID=977794 RepID=A0A8J7WQC9_9ACTN|nr:DUF1365 domain-containing protein [Actinocrinis puniceicyclus]